METQLRTTNPSQKEIEQVLRQIKKASDAVTKFATNLTATERRHLLKPRPGGEKVSELIVRVASDRGVVVSNASKANINENLARVALLEPVRSATSSLLKALDDTIFEAGSKAWWATTAYYTALRGIARSDGTLKQELEPATSFFALGKRKPKVAAAK